MITAKSKQATGIKESVTQGNAEKFMCNLTLAWFTLIRVQAEQLASAYKVYLEFVKLNSEWVTKTGIAETREM